jgi:capsule polysaccharide export protein KpsE/RkpR
MESFFKNKSLLEVINRWKIHLAIIVVLSGALGVLISSPIIMKPKYKSTAIIYPVNIYVYSEESTTEQMLQVLNSNDIKEQMLKSFDLAKHYKIDPKDPQFYTYFLNEYDDNVSINKTEYESVEIKVLDENPKIACNMVDSIVSFYDQKIASLHKRKQREAFEVSKQQLISKSKEIDSLETQITEMREKYGILNYNTQIGEATKGQLTGNQQAKELFKNLQEKGAEYQRLDSLSWYARRDYLYIKNAYETALKEINKKISYSQIISSPIPADKKSYPVRWAVVAITIITSLIFSLIVIAIIDSKQKKA